MLRVNGRVELQVLQGATWATCAARIAEVGSDRFKVTVPAGAGRAVPLLAGERLVGRVEVDGVLYQFECAVLGHQVQPVHAVELSLPARFQKVQRRDFLRLSVRLPVRYRLAAARHLGAVPADERCTWLTDLSGSGCSAVLAEVLPAGTLVDLFLSLPPRTEIHAIAEVVRVKEGTAGSGHIAGLRFVRLAEQCRQQIIRYIFREERERRLRGLA